MTKTKWFQKKIAYWLTSWKKSWERAKMFRARCVIKRSMWRNFSLRSFSRNEQVVRSLWEEKSFVGKHEGDISAFGADIFLAFSVSYAPFQTRR